MPYPPWPYGDVDREGDDAWSARELHLEQLEMQVELERAVVEQARGERDLEGVFLDPHAPDGA